ncbi:MAG: type II/IV secretion system protein [Sedimentisphaerales bacterium]|nr:type II/IV secretion system protein [Sedimentisphaerales bacterium]
MQLSDIELFFNPLRVVFLIFWFFLCMYLVQRFEYSPIIPDKIRASVNVLILIFGPIVLFIFLVLEVFQKVQGYGMPFFEAIKRALSRANEIVDLSHVTGARGKESIVLVDLMGRNLFEVYGSDKEHENDKYTVEDTLKHTQSVIAGAVERLASDILIDPVSSDNYVVRYRIDGMLRTIEDVDFKRCMAIVNSIKAISGMDIAERRRPQDGAFIARTSQNDISFRVASAGVLNGEKLSIRILNQPVMQLTLEDLGMSEKYQKLAKEKSNHQSGMILVCGPTGSGKSTTMQAMLRELDFFTRNVITIEDPIEYVLPKASQIEINTKAGITFAKTLRSVLRQDPDVIFVGEIRDEETASIALGAAQTGHLVFATIHSSSNAASIVRLTDLGIKPLLITSAISLIISQRLIRRLCPKCKMSVKLDDTQMAKLQSKKVDTSKMMRAIGCGYCGETGYKGRIAIFDMMILNDSDKAKILSSDFSVSNFKNAGDEQYRANLKKQAMKLALTGVTSIEEVKRVTSNLG